MDLDYRIEARGKRDWIVKHQSGRYVGAITRFLLADRFEYRTSEGYLSSQAYDCLTEAEKALIRYDCSAH